jgi:hypothetical protein
MAGLLGQAEPDLVFTDFWLTLALSILDLVDIGGFNFCVTWQSGHLAGIGPESSFQAILHRAKGSNEAKTIPRTIASNGLACLAPFV